MTADSNDSFYRLTPDCVIDAVEAQGYLSDSRIIPYNSYENRVYQVGIEESQPLMAKFYRPKRWSDEQIQEEHDFTLELAELEIPVVPPMIHEQRTLLNHAGFRLALYRRHGGHPPEFDQIDQLPVLGRLIGRIHAVGRRCLFQHRPKIGVQEYGHDSVEFLQANDFIPMELKTAYDSLVRDLLGIIDERFAQTPFEPLRLHGDCHPGNILWRDDHAHFVDFDDARNGPAIQDLWMMLSGDRHQQTLQMEALLEGYEEFCDFDLRELNLIESLRSLRIIHYAAWLARRWEDPAFPHNFPWFNTMRYWSDHVLSLREQLAALNEPSLKLTGNC